jgi:hypothetical protein
MPETCWERKPAYRKVADKTDGETDGESDCEFAASLGMDLSGQTRGGSGVRPRRVPTRALKTFSGFGKLRALRPLGHEARGTAARLRDGSGVRKEKSARSSRH